MTVPFAEVIGDPVAQSLSPLIHRHWLDALGLEGDYGATCVAANAIADHVERRRRDPDWRGCNVTIPHKESIIALLNSVDPGAEAVGAVNCVVPGEAGLTGYNSDVDGVGAALDATPIEGRSVVLIGAGGAARAAIAYLAARQVARLTILVRDPAKAEPLRNLAPQVSIDILSLGEPVPALDAAAVIVNASPLGMAGAPAMPPELLRAIRDGSSGTTLFDMVYKPVETPFLLAGREGGGFGVDGLVMLVGQARRAFELFFGNAPPVADADLRNLLVTASGHSSS